MALTRIANLFPEVVHTTVETITHVPGLIYAQKCETWWRGLEHLEPITALLVYRSPLVKDTKAHYRPVADVILPANRFEAVASGTRYDEQMIHGDKGAKFLVARMTQASEFPGGPLDLHDIRQAIAVATDKALSLALAAA